ncbi:hypothetical protein COLO4_06406 [Corchorus olitorius]|uniref:Uncharacterized protein n=1 Tax=Corchorus olitorius TaxID=93759 RepID=A0A1R3KN33_9ROSI|nr:hypothetical protein COLO4_06406 [Corchorus olitorius]
MEDQQNNQPDLPEREELPEQTRKLINTLEKLLRVTYPVAPDQQGMEMANKPVVRQLAKLLIAHQFHTTIHGENDRQTIIRWLRLLPEELPGQQDLLRLLTQQRVLQPVLAYGIGSFSLPQLTHDTIEPEEENIILTNSMSTIIVMNDIKVLYMIEAKNIVQGQLAIRINTELPCSNPSYILTFQLGRPGIPLRMETVALPYDEPTDFTAILYNAKGAASISFKNHLQSVVQQYQPMIIIITDTRLRSTEAYQLASILRYPQVVTFEPMGHSGGIWLLSNLMTASLQQVIQTHDQMIVNFLRV